MAKLTVDDLSFKSLSNNGSSSGKKLSTIGNTLIELDNLSGIHTNTQRLEGEAESDIFGYSVSLSADGSYLAVGAVGFESSKGATYIYKRSGSTWERQTQLEGEAESDQFGWSVSLSADGSYLAVGAIGFEDAKGATYIYKRSGSDWAQQTQLEGETGSDIFGYSVSLSADGSYLAVGTYASSSFTGATYIYKRSGSTWERQTQLEGEAESDQFGWSVSLSADGSYLAVGAIGFEDAKGATYIYKRSGSDWAQQTQLVGENTGDRFGWAVSLSTGGSYLAVGAVGFEDAKGATYIYKRSGSDWAQQTQLVGETGSDRFGQSVSLSADGSYLAVGAYASSSFTGATYIYKRSGSTWTQQSQLIGEDTDKLGQSVSLSADGSYLAVGANRFSALRGATYTYNLEPTIGESPSVTVERNVDTAHGTIQIAESTDVYVYASVGATAQINLTLPKILTDGRILTIIFEESSGQSVNITNSPVGYSMGAKDAGDTIRLMYTLATDTWYVI